HGAPGRRPAAAEPSPDRRTQGRDQGDARDAGALRHRAERMVARRACDKMPANKKSDRTRRETSMKFLLKMLATATALLCCAATPSLAQSWPQKTVRFIVPFPPGGGTDVVARMVAKNLQDKLGQTVIVENRGGANGAIGLM